MTPRMLAVGLSVVTLITVLLLLRRRRIREKYAALWLVLSVGVVVVSAVPGLLTWMAGLVGVVLPSNLVFIVGVAVLFVVAVQLSVEVGSLEEETRTLAEELAMLRLRMEDLERESPGGDSGAAEQVTDPEQAGGTGGRGP